MAAFWRRLLGRRRGQTRAEQRNRRRDEREPVSLRARLEWRDQEDALRECDGLIRDMSSGGLQIECETGFELNQVVEVDNDRGDAARFVVRYCRRSDDQQFLVGLMHLARERRREIRVAVSGEAIVRALAEHSREEAHQVEICDISTYGMRIRSTRPIAAGEAVKVEGATMTCTAVSMYCNKADGGFAIGLQFLDQPA